MSIEEKKYFVISRKWLFECLNKVREAIIKNLREILYSWSSCNTKEITFTKLYAILTEIMEKWWIKLFDCFTVHVEC